MDAEAWVSKTRAAGSRRNAGKHAWHNKSPSPLPYRLRALQLTIYRVLLRFYHAVVLGNTRAGPIAPLQSPPNPKKIHGRSKPSPQGLVAKKWLRRMGDRRMGSAAKVAKVAKVAEVAEVAKVTFVPRSFYFSSCSAVFLCSVHIGMVFLLPLLLPSPRLCLHGLHGERQNICRGQRLCVHASLPTPYLSALYLSAPYLSAPYLVPTLGTIVALSTSTCCTKYIPTYLPTCLPACLPTLGLENPRGNHIGPHG
ncbi:hypothetical protein GGR50DRAFT_401749 [Xylaria sp. CBS 124048]|nr:hypothetical protein GGR50DRAFT_401749 [Xylaria sp. CBS 124048]